MARIEADLEAARGRQVSLKQALADATTQLEEIGAVLRQDEVALVGEQKDVDRARREAEQLAPAGATSWRPSSSELRRRSGRAPRSGWPRRAGGAGRASGARRSTPRRWAASCGAETVALTERLDAMVGELATPEGGRLAGRRPAQPPPATRCERLEREREEYRAPARAAGDARRPRSRPGPRS